MAAENSSVRKREPRGFMTLLSSAACEWFLIFLLFVDAALSYLVIKFAQHCELKTPCLLCSRLDNGFGKKKPGCYWSLLCSNHREEISSLVSCSIHGKFADVHGMCEECLMPIAMQNKSNSELYRLLVGKSWVDIDRSVLQNLMLNKHILLGSPDRRTCSCCSKTWRAKSSAERLLEPNPVGFGASKANVKPPLPRVPGRSRFSRRDSLKRLRDKFTGPMTHHTVGCHSVDTLSHVGYTKLKISSDSESEVPLSEDDDGNTGSHGRNCGKHEYDVQYDRRVLHKPPADSAASEKQAHQSFEVKPLILDQPNLLDLSEHKNVNSLSSDTFTEHGLEDLDWEESYNKLSPSLTPELISLYDCPQPPDVAGDSFGTSGETSKSNISLPHMPALSVLSELLSLCNVPSLSNNVAMPNKINVGGTSEEGDTSVAKHVEAAAGTSSDDACSLESNNMHRADALTQSDETSELSDRHAFEPSSACDSAETEEDRKSLPQVSTSELGLLSKDSSPRTHDKHDESRIDEASSSQVLPISASPKKNDSNYESSDGITVSDIEGENIVDRLKRQVEHDRNCMNSLYKELEEERNAAAIAANQAMAMITRLQEEKAALHMEALQYLRMMEEQAEYDMEALGRANDLLADKEKELQDLEIELEFYRDNFLDETGVHNIQKQTSIVANRVADHTENSPGPSSNSKTDKLLKANANCKQMNSSESNFEDEKVYISQCLKKLEKKIHQAYFSGKLDDMPNGLNSEKIKVEVGNLEDLPPNGGTLLNQENEEDRSLVQKVMSVSNGNPARDTASNGTLTHDKEKDCLHEKNDKFSANRCEINSAIFEKEIAELYDRLEALETDRHFLKHTSDLLRNGKDGLQLVQEIAHQLQELRKMEFKKR
ncbi:hypothetical protein Pfo_006400 [Paulownia fortunei]|nr:hypothetical protein Pfo_006400 [Paulownia fortunei]